ncbi:hypothetical protein Taro_049067 [Colocasia esculenta]|uniref:Uncharacterized protein n=1 Tax=Colocasia esculenta TaxID=4460 RepID=A0A843X9V4_COLES|nr:hypothetical protein [Colocasia esculenta]
MRINFSPRLSNNKGWTGRLFFVGRRKGANIPEWDFPVRVVEPLRKADMAPFLIQGAAAASQSLNTAGVNHAEGYLTEYKLVKYKLSRAWDEDVSARGPAQKAKAVVRGGAVKEAPETAAIAEAASLPQSKRKEKRNSALVELQAGDRTSKEEVSNERRARKKKKATKTMPRVAESAEEVEEEEEDLEPLLARGPRQRTRTPERRASVTPIVDRSEAVMKMSAELGLIMVSDESDRSGGRAKSPVHETQEVLPGEGGASRVARQTRAHILPRGDILQGSGDILPPIPPTSVVTKGCVVGENAAEVIAEDIVVGESAAILEEESTQAPGDAEEGRATAFAASATEDGGEVQPATRQEAVGADRASASTSAVAMTSGSGQPKDLVIDVAVVPSATAAAGDESSEDDDRPLMEVLH